MRRLAVAAGQSAAVEQDSVACRRKSRRVGVALSLNERIAVCRFQLALLKDYRRRHAFVEVYRCRKAFAGIGV